MGVKAGCTPRSDVLEGELNDALFAANFGRLIRNEGPPVYREPALFFRNTFPTEALCSLCQRVFAPLANPAEAGRFFRLSTGFGGGKTHALMALWHLARNIADPTMGAHLLAPAGRPAEMRVIGIDGEGAGYPILARHGEQEARSLAAEFAFQVGGASALNAFGPFNTAAACPDDATVDALLPKNTPVLILLDEVVLHMDKLTEQEVGNLLGFLRILITAVTGRAQAVLVITDPKDQPSNAANTARLMRLAREFEQQTGRQATIVEPIGSQSAQVIVHRLFEQVKPEAAAKASADYFALYQRVAEDHSTLIPEAARTRDYAETIRTGYPLHPRLMDTAENRLRVMPDYNLSRGTLRLFARLVRDLWDDPDRDPELITAGDIDWLSSRIQTDLLNRLDREKFKAAVGADIEGHARELDGGKWDVHRRVASALLLESLPLEVNSGLDPAELTLAVVRPDEAGNEPAEALDRLSGTCWHLYPMGATANGWQFRYEPNILKQIEQRMTQVSREDALNRLRGEVQKSFQGGFARPLSWPPNAKAVPDKPALQLALCDSEAIAKSVVAYEDDTSESESLRTYRNAIMAIAPDAAGLEKSIQRMQRLMAAEQIEAETPSTEAGRLAHEQLKKQRPELIKALKLEAARTFTRLALANGTVLTIDERFVVPPEASPLKLPSGQEAVKGFVENRNLIYGPEDSLDPGLFLDRVFKGAVPAPNQPAARTTAALQRRFLAAPDLRLVSDPSVIRASILRGVEHGQLAVRLDDGFAFDKDGAVVDGPAGTRRRIADRKLQTLAMDETTLVAEIGGRVANDWLRIHGVSEGAKPGELPLPPPPPPGSGPITVTDVNQAAALADKRPMVSIRIKCPSAVDAQKAVGAATALGAPSITIEADLAGDMKDGGKLGLRIGDAKVGAAIKPLALAQTLGNALAPGSSVQVTVVLDFGPSGKPDLGAILRGMQLPEGATIEARFAPLSL
jgi:hypothetical protein